MIFKINPVAKPRMTRRDRWAQRPAVVRYHAFCDGLRELWGEMQVSEQLGVRFVVPMPNSWSSAKKARMTGTPHQQRPDIDNFVKAFLDALCEDDSFVWNIHAQKIWGDEGYIEVVGIDSIH